MAIQNQIMDAPDRWPVMPGTGGLRKMRFSPAARNAGKSGGLRVCYFVIDIAAHIYLATVYAKNEQDNLPPSERNAIRALIREIKSTHERGA